MKKYLKAYAEYNTFDCQTCNMHMTCENGVETSNLYKKSSHFALFLKPANFYFPLFCQLNSQKLLV